MCKNKQLKAFENTRKRYKNALKELGFPVWDGRYACTVAGGDRYSGDPPIKRGYKMRDTTYEVLQKHLEDLKYRAKNREEDLDSDRRDLLANEKKLEELYDQISEIEHDLVYA